MTKIAVISDVHANLHTLDLFFEDAAKEGIKNIICLGDLVTKYFYPKEVVNLIRKYCYIVIKGNCDDVVVNDERYKFARSKLDIDGLEYLDNLINKNTITINNITFNMFHANKNDLESIFNPLFDNSKVNNLKRIVTDYNEMLEGDKPQVVLTGHTHQNYIAEIKNNKLEVIKDDNITVDNKKTIIVNVGSVGEHNQVKALENRGFCSTIDPYLTYGIIESDKDKLNIRIKKIPYKEKLLEVYLDYKKFQEDGIIKNYEPETKRIEDSLLNMGYDKKILKMKKGDKYEFR